MLLRPNGGAGTALNFGRDRALREAARFEAEPAIRRARAHWSYSLPGIPRDAVAAATDARLGGAPPGGGGEGPAGGLAGAGGGAAPAGAAQAQALAAAQLGFVAQQLPGGQLLLQQPFAPASLVVVLPGAAAAPSSGRRRRAAERDVPAADEPAVDCKRQRKRERDRERRLAMRTLRQQQALAAMLAGVGAAQGIPQVSTRAGACSGDNG